MPKTAPVSAVKVISRRIHRLFVRFEIAAALSAIGSLNLRNFTRIRSVQTKVSCCHPNKASIDSYGDGAEKTRFRAKDRTRGRLAVGQTGSKNAAVWRRRGRAFPCRARHQEKGRFRRAGEFRPGCDTGGRPGKKCG